MWFVFSSPAILHEEKLVELFCDGDMDGDRALNLDEWRSLLSHKERTDRIGSERIETLVMLTLYLRCSWHVFGFLVCWFCSFLLGVCKKQSFLLPYQE